MQDFDYFKMKLGPVLRKYGVKKALLFGSFAKGEETEKSDVDLCVDSGLRGLKFVGLIEEIRQALSGKMVDVLDVSHFEEGSVIAKEIARTGVVIYEG